MSIEDLAKEISAGSATKRQRAENPVHYIQFKKETLSEYNAVLKPLNLTTDQEARLFLKLAKDYIASHPKTETPRSKTTKRYTETQ